MSRIKDVLGFYSAFVSFVLTLETSRPRKRLEITKIKTLEGS
jgi:hypothetical protein